MHNEIIFNKTRLALQFTVLFKGKTLSEEELKTITSDTAEPFLARRTIYGISYLSVKRTIHLRAAPHGVYLVFDYDYDNYPYQIEVHEPMCKKDCEETLATLEKLLALYF